MNKKHDVICMGRVGMDLFSQDLGVPFTEVSGFDASVGGSPSNIAIGTSRLGLDSALLTAVGEGLVGDFVLNTLQNEGVTTDYIPRKAGKTTGLALVAIQPPDKFPLQFYRQDPADIQLNNDDVDAAPITAAQVVLLSGTALSRGSCAVATRYAAKVATEANTKVFMDLDYRADQWAHPNEYGRTIRAVLSQVDVVIGTEEEFTAALVPDPENIARGDAATETQVNAIEAYVDQHLADSITKPTTFVIKRGARGVSIYTRETRHEVPGFSVDVLNTVGAGDAFASGLLYGYLHGWDWYKSGRMANACGALVVTRHGCSVAMPYEDEILAFIDAKGGF